MTAIVAVAVGAALIGAIGIGYKLSSDKRNQAPQNQPATPDAPPVTPTDTKPADPPKPPPATKADTKPADPVTKPSTDSKPSTTPSTNGLMAVAIRTTPEGAKVIIDEGKLPPCTSPCLVELPNGRHTATMTLDPYKTEMRIFYVPNDSAVNVNLEKRKGTLEVNSTPPGATVTIDGAEYPQKTPVMIPLVIGKHTVVVSLPGKTPYSQTFEMRSEATISLQPSWAN